MTTLNIPGSAPKDPRRIRSRRSPPPSFLNTLEQQRYSYLGETLAALGHDHLARLCLRWAEEHRATAELLVSKEKEEA